MKTVAELEKTFTKKPYDQIPFRMKQALIDYVADHQSTGNFLRSLIQNDLAGAVLNADEDNLPLLKTYLLWFFNEAPAGLFGKDNYEAHIFQESKV